MAFIFCCPVSRPDDLFSPLKFGFVGVHQYSSLNTLCKYLSQGLYKVLTEDLKVLTQDLSKTLTQALYKSPYTSVRVLTEGFSCVRYLHKPCIKSLTQALCKPSSALCKYLTKALCKLSYAFSKNSYTSLL